ncbi:unnamed protein product [Cylicocyclus nassatus]|uniref:Uncharacterized protein n=1 Tax=Cylicocyclus nassatus TaxID=53992 RepID=A0AA36H734_CYLNA|nr:unnamed protein product [Cylicocyclus nassatus]
MEANEVNNKKDGYYDKSQTRYKWRYFKSLILIFLAVNVEVANAQYLEKPYQQQQPIPSLKCDCPTFGVIDGFAHLTNLILLLLSFFSSIDCRIRKSTTTSARIRRRFLTHSTARISLL